MRLLALKIDNFGTLKDFKLIFSDKLTVINEQNGFGKTTLALFLKSMFYGLPKTTKKKVAENTRLRLTPWQGGLFGGSLDFEVSGKKYRIERYFSDKSGDTFKLFDLDLGKISTDYTENIGVELFSIDAESFERSVYVPQTLDEVSMNLSLNAKLTGLVENSDDLGYFDKAYEKIEKRAKEYKALRGNKGILNDLEKESEDLQRLIKDSKANEENLDRVTEEIKALRLRLADLEAKKAEVRKKITLASDYAALAEQKKSREALIMEIDSLQSRMQEIIKRYPIGLPTEEQINEAFERERLLSQTEAELKILKEDVFDGKELSDLKTFFDGRPTDSNELSALKQKAQRLSALRIKRESILPQLESAAIQNNGTSKGIKLSLAMAVLLLAIGGFVTGFNVAVGVILLVLGVLGVGFGGFLYLKNQIAGGTKAASNEAIVYEAQELDVECDRLSSELTAFVEKYMPVTELERDIDVILEKHKESLRLIKEKSELENKISARQSRFSECRAEQETFFKAYGGYTDGGVAEVLQDVKNAKAKELEIKQKSERLKALPEVDFESGLALELDREGLLLSEQSLNRELDAVQNEITSKLSLEGKLSNSCELLAQYEEQLESVTAELAEKKEHYEVLKTTAELLSKARENLSTRYLDRMAQGFSYYCDTLNGEAQRSIVSPELSVSVEACGGSKEQAYFSAGIKDVMNIAMHLSLADALFENESPILILDDPFVNLDDRRLKNALSMLKLLAEKRQIIYLTCHSSRNL